VIVAAERYSIVETPIGPLLLRGDGTALTRVDFVDGRDAAPPQADWIRDDNAFAQARSQLAAYFAQELTCFDLALAPGGTPFQARVWDALQAIPFGQRTTYGAIAAELGNPRAGRAVGLANGRNPISIIIPCHRLVGADGSLVKYGGGMHRKEWLLAMEARAR
jgi:methylated-DNA-[protein]-cysteine S-methyltransferase